VEVIVKRSEKVCSRPKQGMKRLRGLVADGDKDEEVKKLGV
jgi:hypothetical protein